MMAFPSPQSSSSKTHNLLQNHYPHVRRDPLQYSKSHSVKSKIRLLACPYNFQQKRRHASEQSSVADEGFYIPTMFYMNIDDLDDLPEPPSWVDDWLLVLQPHLWENRSRKAVVCRVQKIDPTAETLFENLLAKPVHVKVAHEEDWSEDDCPYVFDFYSMHATSRETTSPALSPRETPPGLFVDRNNETALRTTVEPPSAGPSALVHSSNSNLIARDSENLLRDTLVASSTAFTHQNSPSVGTNAPASPLRRRRSVRLQSPDLISLYKTR